MRYLLFILLIFTLLNIDCKNKATDPEPGIILNKWARSLEKMNYNEYTSCEAYPREYSVFKKIYEDEYLSDIVIIKITEPDKYKIEKDEKGNSLLRCSIEFNGTVVKRNSREPYQDITGDIDLLKYTDGEKKQKGWLLSNRIITRYNKK